jgi:hypothetical protein
MSGKRPANTPMKTWTKLIVIGFVVYSAYSLLPDLRRYIRMSTM